jgi:hypothetical protein
LNVENLENETVFICAENRLTTEYNGLEGIPENPNVTGIPDIDTRIRAIWINKDENGKYIGFNDIGEGNNLINYDKATGVVKLKLDETDSNNDIGKSYYWIDWYRDTEYAN